MVPEELVTVVIPPIEMPMPIIRALFAIGHDFGKISELMNNAGRTDKKGEPIKAKQLKKLFKENDLSGDIVVAGKRFHIHGAIDMSMKRLDEYREYAAEYKAYRDCLLDADSSREALDATLADLLRVARIKRLSYTHWLLGNGDDIPADPG